MKEERESLIQNGAGDDDELMPCGDGMAVFDDEHWNAHMCYGRYGLLPPISANENPASRPESCD